MKCWLIVDNVDSVVRLQEICIQVWIQEKQLLTDSGMCVIDVFNNIHPYDECILCKDKVYEIKNARDWFRLVKIGM